MFSSCYSTKKHLEDAALLEREGLIQKAYEAYDDVHMRKPHDAKALVGMQRTAQALYDRLTAEASSAYMANDWAGGENARTKAGTFFQRMTTEGLELRPDMMLELRRNEARSAHGNARFAEAEEAFRNKRFEECDRLCGQVLAVEPDRKEAAYLQKMARLEPLYLEAEMAADLGLWRSAYRTMKKVTDQDVAYKDAWSELERMKRKAGYTLAYVPMFNTQLYNTSVSASMGPGQVESQLSAAVKQALLELDDPLITLVDRENTDHLLAEQQRGLNGTYDESYAAEAGKLLGARYVLTGKLLRFDDILSKQIEVQVALLDAETGEIHLSEVVRVNKQEIAKGAPRAQLIDRASKRVALAIEQFDPYTH